MIRPTCFGFNPETASTNSFQHKHEGSVHAQAVIEFENACLQLQKAHISLEVFEDNHDSPLPDSIFPNNWFSTHEGRTMVLYPMLSNNRRQERRTEIISALQKKFGYSTTHDLSYYESENKFLEGTGSVVFDHEQRVAFASLSARTNTDVLLHLCEKIGYLPIVFQSFNRHGQEIYHTNVMLSVSDRLAICCFDSIRDETDRHGIRNFLNISGKTVVAISMEQMTSFGGNVLFVTNNQNRLCVAISTTAWTSLDESQQNVIRNHALPIIVDIPTIEKHGGGGIRCMLAELF